MRDAHILVAWTLIFGNAAAGLWALGAHYLEPLRKRQLWWFTAVAESLIIVQATLGVTIQNREDIEPDDFHMLYGFSMIFTVAILYSYRAQMRDHLYLLYAGGGFFLMGLAIRALII
ncbi:MAG: hypothetical protein ACC660_04015 [Acidimicrobiales bacterium]